MSRNAFKCPWCSEITPHVQLSPSDSVRIQASQERNKALQYVGRGFAALLALTGTGKVLEDLGGKRSYRCLKCGTISCFSADGTFYGGEKWGK